jgi:hypothetical protein
MMTEEEWLQYGIDHDFVWGFCLKHDDGMTSTEADTFHDNYDICVDAFRLKSEYMKNQ